MTLIDWFPALTTTSVLALAMWLAKNLLLTRLTRSVQCEFDAKLEKLRAQLRTSEAQLAALQSGTLGAIQSRRQALDVRRLAAVDQLTEAIIELNKARVTVSFMQVIKWPAASKATESDPKARELFKSLPLQELSVEILKGALKARPFLTEPVWAAYSAYQYTCMTAVLKHKALIHGAGKFIKEDEGRLHKMIVALLPHFDEFLKEHGEDAACYLVESLETKVHTEVQSMLRGEEADVEQLKNAAKVIELAGELRAAQDKAAVPKV
ncbi:hypothetical protein [Methyloversatilis sp.]|uniref:hypothetical protein n=1 Tax=Methyloversatilis sp. TaxID=2569862 RepID=UPI003F709556